jgi:hypothetical protein
MLSLFAAGIVLFVLMIASYSRRSSWIALGSIAMSVALLVGCLLLAIIHDRSHVRTSLAWVASKLPLVVDRQTAQELVSSLERSQARSPCAHGQPLCRTPAPLAEPEPVQAATTTSVWFDSKPDRKARSQSPVAWSFDNRDVQFPVTSPWGLSISGINVSDQAMEDVHAVLKPDSSQAEVELLLDVEGHAYGNATSIPAGARFSLVTEGPGEDGSKVGGAILSLRYVQAGRQKTLIFYLSPAMLANR